MPSAVAPGGADDVTEHALSQGSVLAGAHPTPLLVAGDQPTRQALDALLV